MRVLIGMLRCSLVVVVFVRFLPLDALQCYRSGPSNSSAGDMAQVAQCGPNSSYCIQDIYWIDGVRHRRRDCDSGRDCGHYCRSVPKCLLSYYSGLFKVCCTADLCNLKPVAVIRPITEPYNFALVSEIVAFGVIAVLLITYGVLPHFFAFRVRKLKRMLMLSEYHVFGEKDLFEDDHQTDAERAKKINGRDVDGQLSRADLDDYIHASMFARGVKFPLPNISYPPVTFGRSKLHSAVGFNNAIIERTIPSKYESILYRMMEQGPGYCSIQPIELKELFEEVSIVVKAEGPLLELPSDFVVIGDLRGNYSDLMRWFQLHGYPPKRRYLFLGGMIDNLNPNSVETLTFISAFKMSMPYDVFMLRGVPEALPFLVKKRFPKMIANALEVMVEHMCNALPIAALIGTKILAVHSGIGKKMYSVKNMKKRELPLHMGTGEMSRAALFNTPNKNCKGYENLSGSYGQSFGEDAVAACVKALGIDLIIRSRTPVPDGYFFFAKRRLLSIWSANCDGCHRATSVSIDQFMEISIHSMQECVDETLATPDRVIPTPKAEPTPNEKKEVKTPKTIDRLPLTSPTAPSPPPLPTSLSPSLPPPPKPKPTPNQTPKPTPNQTPKPTPNQTPKPTPEGKAKLAKPQKKGAPSGKDRPTREGDKEMDLVSAINDEFKNLPVDKTQLPVDKTQPPPVDETQLSG